jgi:phosphopentomutase
MLVNLLECDVRAHENKWDEYLRAIQNCDNYAYELWKHIQESPQLKDQTALFITNDHGRHLDGHKNGFVNHGDGCEGCRHISLLALGPDFKKDVVITDEAETIDISKTISRMMGFDMPTSKGRFLSELID